MKTNKYWLKQSKLVEWYQKPSFSFIKKKNNYIDWYPDGKFNVFHNCITRNLELGLGKKVAIHCVNKKKQIKQNIITSNTKKQTQQHNSCNKKPIN